MATSRTVNGIYYDGDDNKITQVFYKRSVSLNVSISKGYGNSPVIMDSVYGLPKYHPAPNFPAKTPITLKLPKLEGGYYTKEEAYAILNNPIYGPDGNLPWVATLPKLTPNVGSPTNTYSNYKAFLEVMPTNDSDLYILRKYLPETKNYMFTNAISLSQLYVIALSQGFTHWKISTDPDSYTVDNPDYINNEIKRAKDRQDYEDALKAKFHLFGTYVFQGLPTNELVIPSLIADTNLQILYWNKTHPLKEGLTTWKEENRWTVETIPSRFLFTWEIVQDGIRKQIPVMDDYWLAVKIQGYKNIEIEIPNNSLSTYWDIKVNYAIEMVPPIYTYQQQLKNLLGIK